MTTGVVVRLGGTVAIAADSLVTFGDTRLPHGHEANEKLFKVRDSWIGLRAGCESDKTSAGPVPVHTIKLKTKG